MLKKSFVNPLFPFLLPFFKRSFLVKLNNKRSGAFECRMQNCGRGDFPIRNA